MRTLPSQDATERKSPAGENIKSEMPSSGGLFMSTSFEMSPVVDGAAAAAAELVEPKRPDISDRSQNKKLQKESLEKSPNYSTILV